MKKILFIAFYMGLFCNTQTMQQENFIKLTFHKKNNSKKTIRTSTRVALHELCINNTHKKPTQETDSQKKIEKFLRFLYQKSLAYQEEKLSQKKIKELMYVNLQRDFYKDLSIDDLAIALQRFEYYVFPEGVIEAICHSIVERNGDKQLDLSALNLSDATLIYFMHYYYLLNKKLLLVKSNSLLHYALRFSLKELLTSKHITLRDIVELRTIQNKNGKESVIIINLANNYIHDLDGLDDVLKMIDTKKIVKIDLQNNYIQSIPVSLFTKCTRLKIVDLSTNLLSERPASLINALSSTEIITLGNPYTI